MAAFLVSCSLKASSHQSRSRAAVGSWARAMRDIRLEAIDHRIPIASRRGGME